MADEIGHAEPAAQEETTQAKTMMGRLSSAVKNAVKNTLFNAPSAGQRAQMTDETEGSFGREGGVSECKEVELEDEGEEAFMVNETFQRDALEHLLRDVFRYGGYNSTHGLVLTVVQQRIQDVSTFLQMTDNDWRAIGHDIPHLASKKIENLRGWFKTRAAEVRHMDVAAVVLRLSHEEFEEFCVECALQQVMGLHDYKPKKKVGFVEPEDDGTMAPAGAGSRRRRRKYATWTWPLWFGDFPTRSLKSSVFSVLYSK